MSGKPYILILCANLKGNLGDFAILDAMGRLLMRHFPGHEILFYHHGNKGVDRVRMAAFEKGLPEGMVSLGPAPVARRPFLLRKFTKILTRLGLHEFIHGVAIEKWSCKLEKDSEFSERLRSAEAVIFAGGSQWGKGDLNMNMFGQLLCAHRLNGRVLIFPFSVSESLLSCNGPRFLREMMQMFRVPLAVRDIETCELLNEIDIPARLFCDSVLALNGIVSLEEIRSMEKRIFICVTSKAGLKPAVVAQVIAALRHQNFQVSLFSTCELEDRPFYSKVRALIEVDLIAPDSWQEAVGVLRHAHCVLTNRLHCLIFSILAGLPAIPVTNRLKEKGFSRGAKLPLSLASLEDALELDPCRIDQERATTIEAQERYVEQSNGMLDAMVREMKCSIKGN